MAVSRPLGGSTSYLFQGMGVPLAIKNQPESSPFITRDQLEVGLAIDDAKVALNRANKLYGTLGETIVIFHETNSPLARLISFLQTHVTDVAGEVEQHSEEGLFTDKMGKMSPSVGFAPVYHAHTTLAAMRVVDAKDKESWQEKMAQSFLYAKFSQYQPDEFENESIQTAKNILLNQNTIEDMIRSIPEALMRKVLAIVDERIDVKSWIKLQSQQSFVCPQVEARLVNDIKVQPLMHLEFESLVLSPNGSLGIRWKKNDRVIHLRHELAKIGGIAKHGETIITTTVGYFPSCTEKDRSVLRSILNDARQALNRWMEQQYLFDKKIILEVDLRRAQFVKFARNDLHPDFILASDLIVNDGLADVVHNATFPEELHLPHQVQSEVKEQERPSFNRLNF